MKEFYMLQIEEELKKCTDIDLLDLIWKLLVQSSEPSCEAAAEKTA